MNILDILSPKAVRVPLVATDKRAAITELVTMLGDADLIQRPADLDRVVWEREQQRSTGIGEGLAIPHGKCDCTDRLIMGLGRPAEPMDFGAIDMKPVRLIVLLASPPDRTADHIQALGKVSRLMSDATFREATYQAESADELYALFRDRESGS